MFEKPWSIFYITSIQFDAEGFLKHVLSLLMFFRLSISQKSETVVVVGSGVVEIYFNAVVHYDVEFASYGCVGYFNFEF